MIPFFVETSDLIRVVNKRKPHDKQSDEVIIDVDRSNPILGNPYVLNNKNDMQERLSVISKFKLLSDTGIFDDELMRLSEEVLVAGKKLALRCWCSPLPCHADVIKQRILYLMENQVR